MQNSTVTENSAQNPAANLCRFVPDPYSCFPTGPPELIVNEASLQCEYSTDEISFLGVSCIPVILEDKKTIKHIAFTNERDN